jgi:cytochrome c2
MNNKTCLAMTVMAVALVTPAPSFALDDLANGKRLATQWCASCHLVAQDQAKASTDAPPFMTIAKRPEKDLEKLPTFLANPAHTKPGTQMPNFDLSRQKISDLVAYIRSLNP